MTLILCLFYLPTIVSGQRCRYNPNGPKEVEFVWMTNKLEGGQWSGLKGRVTDRNSSPIPGAQLALFSKKDDEPVFVGSLETDFKGRFCFGDLPAGKYLLRVGHTGFQRYDFDLEIVRKAKNKKGLEISLDIGY